MGDFEALQIRFGALDTKVDPRAAPPGTLTIAENAQTQTDGVYKKRNGYTALPVAASSCVRMASHASELLVLDDEVLSRYEPVSGTWSQLAGFIGTRTAEAAVALDQTTDIERCTTAYANGLRVDAWIESTTNHVFVRLAVEETGTELIKKAVDTTGAWLHVHAVTVGTAVAVTFSSVALQKVNYVLVNCATETVGASTNIATGAAVSAVWAPHDTVAVSATDIIIAWQSATPNIRAQRYNAVTAASVAGPSVVSADTASAGGFGVMATSGESGYVAYYSTGAGGMRAALFNPATTVQTVAPFTLEASVASVNLNCCIVRETSTYVRIFWDRAGVPPAVGFTDWCLVDNTGTASPTVTLQHARLATKGFLYGGVVYVNVIDTLSKATASIFTIATAGSSALPMAPVAMHCYRSVVPLLNNIKGQLSDVANPSPGIYRASSLRAFKFLDSAGTNYRATVESFDTDFASDARLLPVEANDSVLFANGVPSKYDGAIPSEANFLTYPEITSAVATAAAGMDDGTRKYIAIFETSDANGNTARSTTSYPVSVTCANGAGNNTITLKVTHLSMTRLSWQGRQPVIVSLFRTNSTGGTDYHWVSSITVDPTASVATFTDTLQDVQIAAQRQLYTGGGVLDREPPWPAIQMVVHLGRVWGIPSTDRRAVFYSGDIVPGEDVWYSGQQYFRNEAHGDNTAIASLDNKLIVFKHDRIYKTTGRGANQLGQNDDLSLPQLVSSDCGCIEPRSVVQTPDGIMFLSAKGIYLLNRSEQVSYIGANVDYYTSNYATCTSAQMVPDRQEIRFTMRDPIAPLVTPRGVTLVYNYAADTWTTWSIADGAPAADSAVANGQWYWSDDSSKVYYENASTFLDDGAYVPMTLETAWIAPAGAQGFARVNRVMVLGQWRAGHGLEVQVAKDYSDAYTMDFTWSSAELSALQTEQVAAHLPDQKGESYRVRVSDFEDGASTGAGYWSTGLLLKAKPIRGAFDKLLQAGAKA